MFLYASQPLITIYCRQAAIKKTQQNKQKQQAGHMQLIIVLE
jgi:hypothetical protein